MSARASIRTGDLNRLLKAAKTYGFVVEVRGEIVRLLPTAPVQPLPSDDSSEDEVAWDKALGLR